MKKCPYCAEEVKDEAIKCKHCGSMLIEQSKEPSKRETTTIEATGKEWKGWQIVFVVCLIGGVILIPCGAIGFGIFMLIVGFIGLVITKIGAWWQHG